MKRIILMIATCLVFHCCGLTQTAGFIAASNAASSFVRAQGLKYDKRLNTYTDQNNSTIHMFMFEDGNLLLAGYPTVATEKTHFQLHLFIENTNTSTFLLEYTGSYAPILNIQNGNASPAPQPAVGAAPPPIVINQLDFAVLGPFTNVLIIAVKEKKAGSNEYTALTSTTIQISKTFHASIGSGIVFTTLKDPLNIKKAPLANGDSTLIADNARGRSLLTVTATFYPWGRNNLLMPEWNFKDRLGILVGTTLGSGTATFKNLLIGAQYDFSTGGSVVVGLHYGQRQRIAGVDYTSFQFGKSQFKGDLESKKYTEGDVGFFLGVALDNRIFSQIFN